MYVHNYKASQAKVNSRSINYYSFLGRLPIDSRNIPTYNHNVRTLLHYYDFYDSNQCYIFYPGILTNTGVLPGSQIKTEYRHIRTALANIN
jgi:hypothetical protein